MVIGGLFFVIHFFCFTFGIMSLGIKLLSFLKNRTILTVYVSINFLCGGVGSLACSAEILVGGAKVLYVSAEALCVSVKVLAGSAKALVGSAEVFYCSVYLCPL